MAGQGAGRERSPLTELTPREREVLAEIAVGKSNTSIAESLVLTKRAVEKHINSIFLKLNLSEAEDDEQAGEGDARVPHRGELAASEAISPASSDVAGGPTRLDRTA